MQSLSAVVLLNCKHEEDVQVHHSSKTLKIRISFVYIYMFCMYDVNIVFTLSRSSRSTCPVTNSSSTKSIKYLQDFHFKTNSTQQTVTVIISALTLLKLLK